jgi:hypothetical protein
MLNVFPPALQVCGDVGRYEVEEEKYFQTPKWRLRR